MMMDLSPNSRAKTTAKWMWDLVPKDSIIFTGTLSAALINSSMERMPLFFKNFRACAAFGSCKGYKLISLLAAS